MERIETLNARLIDHYGLDTSTGEPMWRIVFSDDQFEKRLGEYEDRTPSGLFIRRVTEVREVPKYRQWIKGKYVLENLVAIPVQNLMDLPATKTSYEPIFIYENAKGEALPPIWSVTKIVIDSVYFAKGTANNFPKYKDNPIEDRQREFDEMYNYLYGDKTEVSDALAYKEGVVVPSNYKVN